MVFLPWHLVSEKLPAKDPQGFPHPVRCIRVPVPQNLLYRDFSAPFPRNAGFPGFARSAVVVAVVFCAAKGFIARSGSACSLLFRSLALMACTTPLLLPLLLHRESSHVAEALGAGDLPGRRLRLSFIVSRETSQLDRTAFCAPWWKPFLKISPTQLSAFLFYMAFFGSGAGVFLYKAVNTMDSSWGTRTNDTVTSCR